MFTLHRTTRTAFALAASLVGVAGLSAMRSSVSETAAFSTAPEPSDRWLKGLGAKHGQLFDNPAPAGGIGLVHVLNYYDTYNKAYGVKDADVDAVLTFYGATTFYALNDAAWAKYRLGEFLDAKDGGGVPATANPWRSEPVILGFKLPAAGIEGLQRRGATLIVCNNALTIFSGLLAAKRGLEAGAVYQDLKANILPGIELVPAMVIAIEQGTRAGLTYQRQ